jgi:hypothetical protein
MEAWSDQENQISAVFRRQMTLDEDHETSDGYIFVKSEEGALPDRECERAMKYTIIDDPTEYATRIDRGETPGELRSRIQ